MLILHEKKLNKNSPVNLPYFDFQTVTVDSREKEVKQENKVENSHQTSTSVEDVILQQLDHQVFS
jgi:hypothetical protein